jgi:hypothetical protein
MFIQLADSFKRNKKPAYIPDEARNIAVSKGDTEIASNMAHASAQANNTIFASVQQFEASVRKVEEILVNKISVAVTMGAPNMTTDRIEHALFVKQLYSSGEIGFTEYCRKLSNLFPERMQNLPEDLKMRIEACLNIGR